MMDNGGGGGLYEGDSNGANGAFTDDSVCRDFLKNICNRGTRCKFRHPEEAAPEKVHKEPLNFCNDYQNGKCVRDNCRFVHATRADAEGHKRTGNVSLRLAKAIAAVLPSNQDTINGTPICKEWLTGNCSRGPTRCRYWHVNPEEEREARVAEQRGGGGAARAGPSGGRPAAAPQWPQSSAPQGQTSPHDGRSGPPQSSGRGAAPGHAQGYAARNYYAQEDNYGDGPGSGYGGQTKRSRYEELIPGRAVSPGYVEDLEKKNAELIREMDTLRAELARQRERYEDLYYLHTRWGSGMNEVCSWAACGCG